jgi:hypothetical protein
MNRIRAIIFVAAAFTSHAFAGKEVTPDFSQCDLDWASSYTSGHGSKGSPFCASQMKYGHVISGIKTWTPGNGIEGGVAGMQILYDNGDWTTIGSLSGDYHELIWDPNNAWISELYILTNPDLDVMPRHGFFNAYRLRLTDGREIYAGSDFWDKERTREKLANTKVPLSGQPVAFSGWVGKYGIEQLTIQTSDEAANSEIHDVVYSPTFEELNNKKTNE